MSKKITVSLPFCEEDPRFSGKVEVTRSDYPDRSVVGVQISFRGASPIPLSRNRLHEVITALQYADAAASGQYHALLKEMNDGVQEEDAEGLQKRPGREDVRERSGGS